MVLPARLGEPVRNRWGRAARARDPGLAEKRGKGPWNRYSKNRKGVDGLALKGPVKLAEKGDETSCSKVNDTRGGKIIKKPVEGRSNCLSQTPEGYS